MKRGLNVEKKAFLTKQVSAIIQCKASSEIQRPGLSYHLGEHRGTLCREGTARLGSQCQPAALFSVQVAGFGRA